LANAYAHLNKKVLIVGCDLRNPQLHKHLEESRKNNKGLSNYLYDPALNWQNLILKKNVFNFSFDILLAGDIPPNPTLLLSSARFQEFIRESKELYDIIILDTPPTLLVTDSLIISKYAETTIFVLRSGKTEKDLVKYSSKLSQDKKLINIGYVINDIDFKRGYGYGYGYNYGYGYGYGRDVEKISFWKIILNSIKRKKR
jgi:capsular exopolysaccharide synthesis family protein